jgi:hypothetical protein
MIPFINATALSVGLVGFTVAVVAYLAGPFRGAIALRRVVVAWMAYLRGALAGVGVTTGPFGDWLYRARRFVRAGVAVIAAIVVFFVRPLTPAVIVWTAVLALVAILIIELLQRTPEERDRLQAAAEARTTAIKTAGAEAAGTETGGASPSPDKPAPSHTPASHEPAPPADSDKAGIGSTDEHSAGPSDPG